MPDGRVPLLVDAAQSLGWGRGRRAAGRCWHGQRAQVGRAVGVGLLVVRKGTHGTRRRARRTSGSRAGARVREPAGDRGRGGVAAGGAGQAAAEAARLRRADGADPGAGAAADGAGRGGGRGPRPAAARAPGHLLRASTWTARCCCTGWTGPVSRCPSGSSCSSRHADAEPCAEGDGRASRGQRAGCRCRRGPRQEDVERVPGGTAGYWSRCARSWGRRPRRRLPGAGWLGPDLVVDALGRRCPVPVIELAKVIGEVPVGGTRPRPVRRRGGPRWTSRRGARCGRTTWASEPAERNGVPGPPASRPPRGAG